MIDTIIFGEKRRVVISAVAACIVVSGGHTAAFALAPLPQPVVHYTIKPGDQLESLRASVGGAARWQHIAFANFLPVHNTIEVGQKIAIPAAWLPSAEGIALLSKSGDINLSPLLNVSPAKGAPSTGTVPANKGQTSGFEKIPFKSGLTLEHATRFETKADATAVIQLADKTQVKILPHTIAEIPKSQTVSLHTRSDSPPVTWVQSAIRVLRGAVEVVVDKHTPRIAPTDVQTPTSILGVRGTAFRVGYDDLKKTSRNEVISGLVALSAAANYSPMAAAELGAQMGSVLKPEDTQVRVQKLLPAPNVPSHFYACSNRIRFAAVDKAAKYLVQISDTREFTVLAKFETITQPEIDLSNLAHQSWHIKVRAIAADGLEGVDADSTFDLYGSCQNRTLTGEMLLTP